MAKRKRNIDFIAAQKAMGKSVQSTSFEFILVTTVVIVACAMIGWFLLARSQYNTAISDLEAAKTELQNNKNTLSKNEEKFTKFQVVKDANGNPVVVGTDKYGNAIYKYESLTEVAKRVAESLAGAQATSEEVKSATNLTSTIFTIMFDCASRANCEITQFSFNGGLVTLKLKGADVKSMTTFVLALRENGNNNYVSGVEAEGNNAEFTVKFIVINDKLLDGTAGK